MAWRLQCLRTDRDNATPAAMGTAAPGSISFTAVHGLHSVSVRAAPAQEHTPPEHVWIMP